MKFFGSKHKVDKIFIRNYGAFFLALTLCTVTLVYILMSREQAIARIDNQVVHTYNVITVAQELSALVESMVGSQRGYMFTKDDKFMQAYHLKRDKVSGLIATLAELIVDNQSQMSRVDELRNYFNQFSVKLEQRAQKYIITSSTKIIVDNIEEIDGIKDNILQINTAILREEYALLNHRIDTIEVQKSRYFRTLLIGICATSGLLLLFNGFLLRAQRKQQRVEESLKDTEERFSLAIEGTQDGIFDWNIQTGEVFYSRRFFGMLNDQRKAFVGTTDEFKSILHPDDAEEVETRIKSYLEGRLLEYSQEFRLKSKDGRWIWVQSRAKAIFDRNGRALRLVGALTDITYIKEQQARLESEKNAAEEANRAKSDFLAHMSHEIRTPLTAISGIAEILERRQDNLDDKQKKLVKTLCSSTAVLKDLVNDVLDFSKIESGELELEDRTFSLVSLFEEVISMMAVRANEKGISFVFDYTEVRNMDFQGDKARLRQIVVNLIGNAIKFTKEGGVTVRAYRHERDRQDFLNIGVTDTGIGIEPDNFNLIFERFKQADTSISRKYGGTGLGLPISRNLARLMGGNIILSSEPGKGSTFTVYLPLKLKPETGSAGGKAPEKSSDKTGVDRALDKKILMVEDYEGNITMIGYVLDELGCSYDVARTGAEAVSLWKKNHYALILMDIQMPEMDGFAATRAIRGHEKTEALARTPIIGMTAHALVGDKDKCMAAGMDAYLPKPIVEADLTQQILKYVRADKRAA